MSEEQQRFILIWLLILIVFLVPVVSSHVTGRDLPEMSVNVLRDLLFLTIGLLGGMLGVKK